MSTIRGVGNNRREYSVELKNQAVKDRFDIRELQKSALEHYDRMIAWAREQRESAQKNYESMELELGENYYGQYCPYCTVYSISSTEPGILPSLCGGCPLNSGNNNTISTKCCNGLWVDMVIALDWRQWITAAEKVRAYIAEHGAEERRS